MSRDPYAIHTGGVGWSGMDRNERPEPLETTIRQERGYRTQAELLASEDGKFLLALQALQNAAEAARTCYCRRWSPEQIDNAWAHLVDASGALEKAMAAMTEITKGFK